MKKPWIKITTPTGKEAIIYRSTHYGHVLSRHPEMKDKLHLVITSLANPTYIYESEAYDGAENHYLDHGETKSLLFGKYLKSCVDYNEGGIVKTYFFTDNISEPKSKLIWPLS